MHACGLKVPIQKSAESTRPKSQESNKLVVKSSVGLSRVLLSHLANEGREIAVTTCHDKIHFRCVATYGNKLMAAAKQMRSTTISTSC